MTSFLPARLIADHLRHFAFLNPDGPAMVWGERRIDYRSYHEAVAACRALLARSGVTKGDRIAILAPPRPEVMILFLAISDLGAIFLGLNPRGTQAEHEIVLDDAQPTLLFSVTDNLDQDIRPELRAIAPRFRKVFTFDVAVPGISSEFSASLDEAADRPAAPSANPEDPAVLVYTSGSTGKPKGALVSHRSLLAGMGAQADPFRHITPARMMFHVPIQHLGSVGNTGTTTLILGGTLIFMDNFSPRGALELIAEEKVTIWSQVPTMFLMQMAIPEYEIADLTSIRIIFFAGSVMPAEAVQRLARLGVPMLTGYGLTETSGPITLSLPDVPLADLSATIGTPCPGVEVRVADEHGVTLPDGVEGEILARGACIFPGYFKNEAATNAAIDADGWFRTGDLAMTDNGRIMITGRKQDAFKSGGVNIYPREVEEVLQDHASVAIACVVSAPDPVYQEIAVAFLVPRAGEAIDEPALRRYCAERLTKYKIPRRFIVRSELPVIGIGKVDKVKLRAEARAGS